jgi:glycosyltransferase involved in cell wall biosynthesis
VDGLGRLSADPAIKTAMGHSTMIKVLAIDQGIGVWGAQTYLLRLRPLLAERGIELILAAPTGCAFGERWLADGGAFHGIPLPVGRSIRAADGEGGLSPLNALRAAISVPRAVGAIARLARETEADAIYANSHWIHLDSAIAGRVARVPVVLQLHEQVHGRLGEVLRSVAVLLSSKAIAVSRAVAADLHSARVMRRVVVIPNGIDLFEYAPRPADHVLRTEFGVLESEILIATVCRIDPDKRIEDILAVAGALADSKARFIIVGETSGEPGYEREVRSAAQRDLKGNCTFVGSRQDIARIMGAADLILHAGVVEGMPLGLIEAQATGKPVVAYNIAGIPDVVLDGVTGILAEPADREALTNAVRRLVDSKALRIQMGDLARERMESNHDIRKQADAHNFLIASVIAQ